MSLLIAAIVGSILFLFHSLGLFQRSRLLATSFLCLCLSLFLCICLLPLPFRSVTLSTSTAVASSPEARTGSQLLEDLLLVKALGCSLIG